MWILVRCTWGKYYFSEAGGGLNVDRKGLDLLHGHSRLSLSRIPRDSLKHFEISVPRHIRVERVRKTINWTTTFNKSICNLTPEVRNIYI